MKDNMKKTIFATMLLAVTMTAMPAVPTISLVADATPILFLMISQVPLRF